MKSTHHGLNHNSDAFDQPLTSNPPQRLYKLTYRGLSYDRLLPLPTPIAEPVAYAIYSLSYRGVRYWLCRYRTANGTSGSTPLCLTSDPRRMADR